MASIIAFLYAHRPINIAGASLLRPGIALSMRYWLGFQVHFLLAIDRTLKSSTAKGKQSTTSYASRRIIDCKSNHLPKIFLQSLSWNLIIDYCSVLQVTPARSPWFIWDRAPPAACKLFDPLSMNEYTVYLFTSIWSFPPYFQFSKILLNIMLVFLA